MDALIQKISLQTCLMALWLCSGVSLHALTLQEGLDEAISRHPKVQEKLYQYKDALEDLRISESSYMPSLDYTGYLAREKTDISSLHQTLTTYEHSLQVTQNLFNGFSSTHEVEYQKSRVLMSAHAYIATTNEIAYQFVESYNRVLHAQKMANIAKNSVEFQQAMHKTVETLSAKLGKQADSEMAKIETALLLARSNDVVAQHHLEETLFNLERIIGRRIEVAEVQSFDVSMTLPKGYEEAYVFAKGHHPLSFVNQYAIKAAHAKHQEAYHAYYPKVDAYVRQSWSDNTDGEAFTKEQHAMGVIVSYNLYKGGADAARIEKNALAFRQKETLSEMFFRTLYEQNRLSWSSKIYLSQQLNILEHTVKTSYKTRELYAQEYAKNRRSLLELLVAHNEYIAAQTQTIQAEHDLIFAHYRILDAMGSMVQTILGSSATIHTQRVAL